ncbi:unnamed protein product [marine sediment metagenome]|uniref:Response regulatory domain-containing protein n=1 Tax=marine sediment metagenome TaxID=412755 RepID=X1JG08_9ZZZZ
MGKQPKILVVDSKLDFVRLARNALGISGYQVVTAPDRKGGLEMAREQTPDVIIVGALEPRGDAFKLSKELRDSPRTQNIPILVVDVRPEEQLQKGWRWHEGMQMNAEDYIPRPIEPADLVESVKRILNRVMWQRPIDSTEILKRMEETLKRVEKLEMLLAK